MRYLTYLVLALSLFTVFTGTAQSCDVVCTPAVVAYPVVVQPVVATVVQPIQAVSYVQPVVAVQAVAHPVVAIQRVAVVRQAVVVQKQAVIRQRVIIARPAVVVRRSLFFH